MSTNWVGALNNIEKKKYKYEHIILDEICFEYLTNPKNVSKRIQQYIENGFKGDLYLPNTKIMLGGRGLELTCGVENRLHYEKYWEHGMADLLIVGDAETAIIDAVNKKFISKTFYQKLEIL